MTAPLPPDPADVTDGEIDRRLATVVAHRWMVDGYDSGVDANALVLELTDEVRKMLAAERAAVARPVLALAEEAKRASTYTDWHAIAARLSAVAAALGETGGGQ